MAANQGDRILDAGGGTGRNALTLRETGARIVVCDYSFGMLRRATERDLPAVLADVTRLPFATGTFNRTLVVDAFHHFVDPSPEIAQTLATGELLRTLRAGGRLFLEEPNTRRWQAKLIAAVEHLLLMRSRFLAPEILVGRLEGSGVRCVLREEHGFSVDLVFEKAALSDECE
jgi:demethylmenaquinone methyltransferase/2-methoxy-6-polyprenyl-1,4-benzoquinol methylase